MEFTRKPSDPDRIIEPVELPEGDALLIADVPDYVNLPPQIYSVFNLPIRADILSVHHKLCPVKKELCTHYKLNAVIHGKHVWVAKSDQFYWYLE
jgi:hypothetical protein